MDQSLLWRLLGAAALAYLLLLAGRIILFWWFEYGESRWRKWRRKGRVWIPTSGARFLRPGMKLDFHDASGEKTCSATVKDVDPASNEIAVGGVKRAKPKKYRIRHWVLGLIDWFADRYELQFVAHTRYEGRAQGEFQDGRFSLIRSNRGEPHRETSHEWFQRKYMQDWR